MKRIAVAINMPTRVMMVPSRMYRNTTEENMATLSKCRNTVLWQDLIQANAVDPPKALFGPIIFINIAAIGSISLECKML